MVYEANILQLLCSCLLKIKGSGKSTENYVYVDVVSSSFNPL
jgi:hypothetical protein